MQFQRNLLLSNDMTISIFRCSSSDLHTKVMLSPLGDYVMVIYGNDQYSYLTRFVPSKYYSYVEIALSFRNTFAKAPYMCDRFHADKSASIPSFPSNWISRKDSESVFGSGLFICPYRRRVICQSEVRYVPEKKHYLGSSQYQKIAQRNGDDETAILVAHTSMYPLATCPSYLLDQLTSSHTSVPSIKLRCDTLKVSPANLAASLFKQFQPALSLLHKRSYYPPDTQYPVVVEYVDNTVYLFSGYNKTTCNLTDSEVDAWILQPSEDSDLNAVDDDSDYIVYRVPKSATVQSSDKQLKNPFRSTEFWHRLTHGSVLTLSGDQFSYFADDIQVNESSGMMHDCLHGDIHILDGVLSGTSLSGVDEQLQSEEQRMRTVLTNYRTVASHLVIFRRHLNSYHAALPPLVVSDTSTSTSEDVGIGTTQSPIYGAYAIHSSRPSTRSSAESYLKEYVQRISQLQSSPQVDHHIYRITNSDHVELTALYSTLRQLSKSHTHREPIQRKDTSDSSMNTEQLGSDIVVTQVKALFPNGDMLILDLLAQSVLVISSALTTPRTFTVDDCLSILRTGDLSYGTDLAMDKTHLSASPSSIPHIPHSMEPNSADAGVNMIHSKLPLLLRFLRYIQTPQHVRDQSLEQDQHMQHMMHAAIHRSNRFLVQHHLANNSHPNNSESAPLPTQVQMSFPSRVSIDEDTHTPWKSPAVQLASPGNPSLYETSRFSDDKENLNTHENQIEALFGNLEPTDKESINQFLSIQASLMKDPKYRDYISRKAVENCSEFLQSLPL